MCSSFCGVLQKLQKIVYYNQNTKGKSEDLDLFYGTHGNKQIFKPPGIIDAYQTWIQKFMVKTGSFSALFMQETTLEVLSELTIKQDSHLLIYLTEDVKPLVQCCLSLQDG